jgi:drug/metabolite transporter (DMT)-like permease
VLLAAAIGTLVLGERFGRYRIVAAAVIAAGAIVLQIG